MNYNNCLKTLENVLNDLRQFEYSGDSVHETADDVELHDIVTELSTNNDLSLHQELETLNVENGVRDRVLEERKRKAPKCVSCLREIAELTAANAPVIPKAKQKQWINRNIVREKYHYLKDHCLAHQHEMVAIQRARGSYIYVDSPLKHTEPREVPLRAELEEILEHIPNCPDFVNFPTKSLLIDHIMINRDLFYRIKDKHRYELKTKNRGIRRKQLKKILATTSMPYISIPRFPGAETTPLATTTSYSTPVQTPTKRRLFQHPHMSPPEEMFTFRNHFQNCHVTPPSPIIVANSNESSPVCLYRRRIPASLETQCSSLKTVQSLASLEQRLRESSSESSASPKTPNSSRDIFKELNSQMDSINSKTITFADPKTPVDADMYSTPRSWDSNSFLSPPYNSNSSFLSPPCSFISP